MILCTNTITVCIVFPVRFFFIFCFIENVLHYNLQDSFKIKIRKKNKLKITCQISSTFKSGDCICKNITRSNYTNFKLVYIVTFVTEL